MVQLSTSDNEVFNVDRDVAERSQLIKTMLDDLGDEDAPIPLVNVSSNVLKKVRCSAGRASRSRSEHSHSPFRPLFPTPQVLEYCAHHRNDPPPPADEGEESRKRTTEIGDWDAKFINVDQEMLFEIILAANYLDIKPLLDVGCKTV